MITKLCYSLVAIFVVILLACNIGEAAKFQPGVLQVQEARLSSQDEKGELADRDEFDGADDLANLKDRDVEQLSTEELLPLDLDISITGCVVGKDGERSTIIFDNKRKTQKFYKKGDFVYGYLVVSVSRERVIFAREGEYRVLEFVRQGSLKHTVADGEMSTDEQGEVFKGNIKTYATQVHIERSIENLQNGNGKEREKRPKSITFRSKQKILN